MTSLVTNIQGYSIHDGPGIRTVVFFKGCGLACQWCSNPECISPRPEVGFVKNLCTKCGKCADVCPNQALDFDINEGPHINRDLCTGCGSCSEACSYKALILYGKPMSADEIFDVVSRDKMFYQASGGGVTVSGGEALLQSQVVQDLFKKCRQADIHTCIETAGFVSGSAFKQVLPYTNYILFDLKIMDPEKHRQYTGKTNELILSNAKIIAENGVDTLFRMPVIPGRNDNARNIKETAAFLLGMDMKTRKIELMPYHRLGKGKYDSLGKKYPMDSFITPTPEQIAAIKKTFEDEGITCTISR